MLVTLWYFWPGLHDTLWLPNSPDLNPVNYKVCGIMQKRVYRTPILNVADLTTGLLSGDFTLDAIMVLYGIKNHC